jgi:hypothetical protein
MQNQRERRQKYRKMVSRNASESFTNFGKSLWLPKGTASKEI